MMKWQITAISKKAAIKRDLPGNIAGALIVSAIFFLLSILDGELSIADIGDIIFVTTAFLGYGFIYAIGFSEGSHEMANKANAALSEFVYEKHGRKGE